MHANLIGSKHTVTASNVEMLAIVFRTENAVVLVDRGHAANYTRDTERGGIT
jgi:hypothetical protein